MQYDRRKFADAARRAGDDTPADTARRLRIPRNTAWRLWTGRGAPSARVAAAVERAYRVPASQLITPATQETEPAA